MNPQRLAMKKLMPGIFPWRYIIFCSDRFDLFDRFTPNGQSGQSGHVIFLPLLPFLPCHFFIASAKFGG